MKPTRKEVDLGPPVVAWLAEQGHEVYQEVSAWAGVADLVGVCAPVVVVVELKVALSWELLYQAQRWRNIAHQVWVAVPAGKRSDGRSMALRVFEEYGIGVLTVDAERWTDTTTVNLESRAAFNRRADASKISSKLHEQHKTFAAAGSHGGRHWTEFKSTCDRLRRHIAEHPGVTMREAMAEVKHHYSSDAGARSRLVSLIQRGIIDGIRVERDGRAMRLYATGAT